MTLIYILCLMSNEFSHDFFVRIRYVNILVIEY